LDGTIVEPRGVFGIVPKLEVDLNLLMDGQGIGVLAFELAKDN
jgi:hypothetical protein